jgi:hypothetical protein
MTAATATTAARWLPPALRDVVDAIAGGRS